MLSFVLKGFKTVNVKKDKIKYPQMITNKILPVIPQDTGVLDTMCIQQRNSINLQQRKSIIYYCQVITGFSSFKQYYISCCFLNNNKKRIISAE